MEPRWGGPRACSAGLPAAAAAAAAAALAGALGLGCGGPGDRLLLASTTSTEDTGLFEVLLPAFEAAHPGYRVSVVAVGSGQALELGRRGDADVLLVHAPAAESAFVAAGHGARRCAVMYNDFVIVGPEADPAGLRGLEDAVEAVRRIAASRSTFVSRGDDSGTHLRERALWSEARLEPAGDAYVEAGQGMGETLRMAAERDAYTLTDRGTLLAVGAGGRLDVLVEGDARLVNQYSVIPVVGAAHPEGADAFADWITGAEGQAVIAGFGAERVGRPLFVPNASGCASGAVVGDPQRQGRAPPH